MVVRSRVSAEPVQEEDRTEVAWYLVPATVNWTGAAAASATLVVASTTRPPLVVVTLNDCAWITIAYPGPAAEPASVSVSRDPSVANRAPGWTVLRGLAAGAAAAGAAAAAAGTAVMASAALSTAVAATGRRVRNRAVRGRVEPIGPCMVPLPIRYQPTAIAKTCSAGVPPVAWLPTAGKMTAATVFAASSGIAWKKRYAVRLTRPVPARLW